MSGKSSRRDFLVTATLAGAALAAGAGAGCGTGAKEPPVEIDRSGRLVIRDPEIGRRMENWAESRKGDSPDSSNGFPILIYTRGKRDPIVVVCRGCTPLR